MSVNRQPARMRAKSLEVGKRGIKQTVSTSLPTSLEGFSNKGRGKIERRMFDTLVTGDSEKRGRAVEGLTKNSAKQFKQLQKSFSLPRLDLLPSVRENQGNFYMQSSFTRGRAMTSSHGAEDVGIEIGKLHRRGRLQRGATWHDGLTAATRDQGSQDPSFADRDHIDWSFLKRHKAASPRSKEYQMVFNELKILPSDSDSQDATNTRGTFATYRQNNQRKSRAIVSKRWCVAKTKLNAAAALKNIGDTTKGRLADFQKTPLNIDDTLIEETETETETSNENSTKDEDTFPAKFTPKSRGWIIVKKNLSKIAEMAPKDSIDTMPVQFTNIVQIVRAKQFRLMMKRRASFIENGVFKFDEAKADLYKRYDKISSDTS